MRHTTAEPTRSGRRGAPLDPIKAQDFGYDQARHLLWRAGFGGTPAQIQLLAGWGPERAVDYILDVEKVPTPAVEADRFDKDIMRPPSPEEEGAYRRARRSQDENILAELRAQQQERERRDRMQVREVQRWWLTRMIESPRPLEEKMTLFWHGHFATSFRTIENSYHMFMQNELFRRNAVGNFGELLFAIVRDPAMLAYLDNNDSRKERPNENLARELMELFSLGVGNYGEGDIKEGARALTGYGFRDDEFVFQRDNHDPNPKTILGEKGPMDGDGFVRAILGQRACSRFIAGKLYSFFVADVPIEGVASGAAPDAEAGAVVKQLSATFLSARYEVKPVLRRLFLSQHFYSEPVVNQHIKSPVELVVGAVRSLNTPVRDLSLLLDAMDLMGQSILMPPSVKGWVGGRAWINTSTLFVRQNILAFLLTGKKARGYDVNVAEEKFDPMPLLGELAQARPGDEARPEPVIDYLLRFTLGRAPDHARDALRPLAADTGGRVTSDLVTAWLLLITAMPEYQLC
jgi:uncharacterized protein (DUF1800 family)